MHSLSASFQVLLNIFTVSTIIHVINKQINLPYCTAFTSLHIKTRCRAAQLSHPADGNTPGRLCQSIMIVSTAWHFIHSTNDLIVSQLHQGISDYSNAWWESGSSSLRHKRRKCTQNHITLSCFCLFQPSQYLALFLWQLHPAFTCLSCILQSCFCFMSFPVPSLQPSFSLMPPSLFFFPALALFLFILSCQLLSC